MYPPAFNEEIKNVVIVEGRTVSVKIPSFSDGDNDTVILEEIDLGSSSPFVKFTYPYFKISPPIGSTGTYTISLTLNDTNPSPLVSLYSFNITVLPTPSIPLPTISDNSSTEISE